MPLDLLIESVINQDALSGHTPNSYVIEKDLNNLLRGELTEAGLEHQVITFLKERASLAVDQFSINIGQSGVLYSPDFPGVPLTELYGRKSGDLIYDLRADYDSRYINTIEAWADADNAKDLSWIRFSPTTGAMSRETKIEIGMRFADKLDVISMTIPFRTGQNVEDAFAEVRKIATRFDSRFSVAESELTLLETPLDLRTNRLRQHFFVEKGIKRDYITALIDKFYGESRGENYYLGRSSKKNVVAEYESFKLTLDLLRDNGILEKYFTAMKAGNLDGATLAFNNIVNHFDRLLSQAKEANQTMLPPALNEFMPEAPAFVAAGCGGFGRRVKDLAKMGVSLGEYSKNNGLPSDFGEPHFGTCGSKGKIGPEIGCYATTIVGGCELCVNCHLKYNLLFTSVAGD